MRSARLLFSLILTLFLLVSCGGGDGGSSGGAQPQEDGTTTGSSTGGSGNVNVTYDSDLTGPERQALVNSTDVMGDLVIDGNQVRRFTQIFGGRRSSNVVNYFETRVNYFLSADTTLESRVVVQPASTSLLGVAETLASNPRSLLWYFSKISEPDDVKFEINDKLLDINSSRFGVMQVGAVFGRLDPIEQIITLVHEARHSDCTGGALASDLERFEAGLQPLYKPCGHAHEICPEGHPLAGLFACDAHPWGAYIVDAIYAVAVSQTCTSCSETQKQVAESMALDALSRPLYDVAELLDGRFGPPDMSSSNQVR